MDRSKKSTSGQESVIVRFKLRSLRRPRQCRPASIESWVDGKWGRNSRSVNVNLIRKVDLTENVIGIAKNPVAGKVGLPIGQSSDRQGDGEPIGGEAG